MAYPRTLTHTPARVRPVPDWLAFIVNGILNLPFSLMSVTRTTSANRLALAVALRVPFGYK